MSSSIPHTMQPMALDLVLPWQPSEAQEASFKRLLKRILVPLLIFFIVIPWLPIFEKEYEERELDVAITKVLLKPLPVEKPPVIEKPKEIIKPKPVKKVVKPKEPVKAKPKVATIKTPAKKKNPGSAPKTAVKSDKVAEKVSVRSSQGLNELSNQLSALRGSLDLAKMQNKNVATNTRGSVTRSSRERLGQSHVTQKSGGINVDGNLMKNESTTLASHTTTAVDGLVEGGNGPSGSQSYLSSQQGKRDMESIRKTLERTKSNVHTLYQRALLNNPDLEGKFVFKLVIEPNGAISQLSLVSSELGLQKLERDILARIKRVNFGPEDVSQTAVEYKFVFLPS